MRRSSILDGNGQAGDAVHFSLVIEHFRLPDVEAAADLDGFADAGDPAFGDGAQVVGVDFDADRHLLFRIDAHPGGDRAERFGQHAADPAVEQAEGLHGSVIDGHCAFEEIFTDFGDLDAEMLVHMFRRRAAECVEVFEGIIFKPDHF